MRAWRAPSCAAVVRPAKAGAGVGGSAGEESAERKREAKEKELLESGQL